MGGGEVTVPRGGEIIAGVLGGEGGVGGRGGHIIAGGLGGEGGMGGGEAAVLSESLDSSSVELHVSSTTSVASFFV